MDWVVRKFGEVVQRIERQARCLLGTSRASAAGRLDVCQDIWGTAHSLWVEHC